MTTPASRVTDERLAQLIETTPDDQHTVTMSSDALRSILTELQSLRSLSSDSVSDGSKGVRVKPLEWTQVIPGRLFADLYMIERLYLDDWRLFLRADNHGDRPKFIAGPFTLDEAKAAAQADYEQRILSALDSGTGGQQPVAAPIGYATAHSLAQLAIPMTSSFDVRIYRKDYFPDKTDWPENLTPIYAPTEPKAGVVSEPWTRQDLAEGLALLDGVKLQRIKSSVGPEDDANNWRKYLGDADDLLAHLSLASSSSAHSTALRSPQVTEEEVEAGGDKP